jgi:signal transduction histidine kinase
LRNLMINAATHGRRARVRVEGSEGAKAQVIVEDEGPGIPHELLGQVFEPFFRVDPGRRQNIAGAGLGLTIAREIVQRAGGDIKISNRKDGGLKQVVELAKGEELAAVKSAAE